MASGKKEIAPSNKRGILPGGEEGFVKKTVNKLLPKFVKDKIAGRPHVQKILFNMGWLTFDKLFQLLVSLSVGIWVARYLGPADFGLLNFVLAIGALFGPFVGLGLVAILVRELINKPKKKNALFGIAFWIQLVTGIIAALGMVAVVMLIRPSDSLLLFVTVAFSIGYIFQAFDILSNWFDSRVESKKVVWARTISVSASSLFKIFAILSGMGVIFFAIATLFETIVRVSCLLWYYFKEKESIFRWNFDFSLAKRLLRSSLPLIFSGAMVVIYLRIDQVMIGLMLNDTQVGLYSVSVKVTEAFYFLPTVILTSLFPSLVKSKKMNKKVYMFRLQKLFDLVTWFPFLAIVPMIFLSGFIINTLYGPAYAFAATALSISIVSLFAISIKLVVENYLINENYAGILFFTSFLGAASNVLLNLFLIPAFGINGAAIATVISYSIAAYAGVFCFKKTRQVFFMLLRSFNLFRVLKEFKI